MTSKLPWDAYQTSTGTALADVIICECYNWNRICWTGNDWKKQAENRENSEEFGIDFARLILGRYMQNTAFRKFYCVSVEISDTIFCGLSIIFGVFSLDIFGVEVYNGLM